MEKFLRAARGIALAIRDPAVGGCGATGQGRRRQRPRSASWSCGRSASRSRRSCPAAPWHTAWPRCGPQVSGIIKERLYTEGAEVKAGQALYQLDPAPYQAAYDSAQAAVAKAAANTLAVQLKYDRCRSSRRRAMSASRTAMMSPPA